MQTLNLFVLKIYCSFKSISFNITYIYIMKKYNKYK